MKQIDRNQLTKWIRSEQTHASKQKDSAFEAFGMCQQFSRWQRRFELLGDCLAILNEFEKDREGAI
jgi:hypothetical protein